ncbi:hypothetical protein AOLI_G00222090 [Acnodon oligacanthus]
MPILEKGSLLGLQSLRGWQESQPEFLRVPHIQHLLDHEQHFVLRMRPIHSRLTALKIGTNLISLFDVCQDEWG